MKKKSFWIFIVVAIILVAGAYQVYDRIFPKAGAIKQLKLSEIETIYVYNNDENEIELSDSEIEELFTYINEAEPTRIISVNDYPNVRPYYVVEIESVDRYFRYMIYEENGKVYVELPYEGVYGVDAEVIDILR